MKVSYTACDKCGDAVSSGYVLVGELRRMTEKGEKEEAVLPVGEYCTACFVGSCMANKLGLEETSKYGTGGIIAGPKPPKVGPLL